MRLLPIIAAASLLSFAAVAEEHGPATIAQMGFLKGDWSETRDGVTTREAWVGPEAGVMAGISITSSAKAGFRTRVEFMSIAEDDGSLVFTAHPDGQPQAAFRLIEADNGIATFENKDHDFPQRITYEISGENFDILVARISGTVDGAAREISWSYRRAGP